MAADAAVAETPTSGVARTGRRLACVAGMLALAWPCAAVFRASHPLPLGSGAPQSTVIAASNGELLRVTLASDGQYRIWVPLERMPARLPEAVVLYEDRWFYWHPGVNPVALLRAAWSNVRGGRRLGASTITMQLARRWYGINTRSAPGKLRQIAAALWLEMRYGKRTILQAYLNLAPYGGNVEGAGAAARVLFSRPLTTLAVPQLMSLAVIPQNPGARRLASRTAALDDARRRLWARWVQMHPSDGRFSGDVTAMASSSDALPFFAPHFTDAMLSSAGAGAGAEMRTTLELPRQRNVERMLRQYVDSQSALGVRNAAALLLEVMPGGAAEVRAYVGSADYRNPDIAGQVNAVTAKRSPGSTLKPFVYALAVDQGQLHPRTILKDTPTAFGPFSPENFDGRFVGPIAAEDALIRSRNVPAVAVASQLAHPNLYDFMRASGVARLQGERHYGLALALGGGEVTMEELGRMYAVLRNGGRLPTLQYQDGADAKAVASATASASGEQLLSAEASFIALDMLSHNPRPDTGQPAFPPVAWKTGTSWGFHDAWSVGIFGRYVLVVWVGNFDNTPNPAFVGVQVAAPLMFRIVDSLRHEGLSAGDEPWSRPRHVERVEVCAASGDLPNAECPLTMGTWYIPGKSPIRLSTLHRRVFVDAGGRRVCRDGPGVHSEVFEFWTSDMLRLFRDAGMPRRVPPATPVCEREVGGVAVDERDAPQILAPLRGVVYSLRLAHLEPIDLRAVTAARARALYWFAGNAYLGRSVCGEVVTWLPPQAGHYLLRAVDDAGAATTRELEVETLP